MTKWHVVFACTIFLLAGSGMPAMAGEPWPWWDYGSPRHAAHHAIYELENGIARLEADPELDDGFKAPLIATSRADVRRLRASLPRAQWRWTSPCCYSRSPIYIR